MGQHWHQLTHTDRLRIEANLNVGRTPRHIADMLHVHISTIYREIKRGRYAHMNSDLTTDERYSPDIAQRRCDENMAAKGAPLKIGNDYALAAYIEDRIVNDKYSPAAVLGEIAENGISFSVTICPATLYSYIDKGVFLRLSNKDLPVKGVRKRKYNHVRRAARAPKGESIEHRPESINSRCAFGHWEMDCVEGKKKTKRTMLVFTERKTRHEIIIPMRDQTSASVVSALDRLERKYGKLFPQIFASITVDNGSEFSDCEGMERSIYGGKRTTVYYCHPYCASERGSNENQNRMFRRHFPKGTDFRRVPVKQIKSAEDWMNNYPRKQFGYHTSREQFEKCMEDILGGATPGDIPRRNSPSLPP